MHPVLWALVFFSLPSPTTEIPQRNYSSWQTFLRNLPTKQGPILEYSGSMASDQSKHFVLVNYDVGNRDLQQCADFLMRLRAEYLFQSGRANEISFRFTSGQAYSFRDHCKGLVPVVAGSKVTFRQRTAVGASGASLRKYLDLVYTYAGGLAPQGSCSGQGF